MAVGSALVTGGAGHVGAAVAARLRRAGWKVRVLDRRAAPEGLVGDVRDATTFAAAARGCDIVVHAAMAYDGDDATLTPLALQGLENAAATGRRLIWIGSAVAAGVCDPQTTPRGRDEACWNEAPATPYARAKVTAERRLHERIEAGLDAVALLPAMVVGPDDPTGTASNRRLRALSRAARWAPALPGGLAIVDVRDVAEAVLRAIDGSPPRLLLSAANLTTAGLQAALRAERGLAGAPRWRLPSRALLAAVGLYEAAADWSGRAPAVRRSQLAARLQAAAWFDASRARDWGWAPRPWRDSVADAVAAGR